MKSTCPTKSKSHSPWLLALILAVALLASACQDSSAASDESPETNGSAAAGTDGSGNGLTGPQPDTQDSTGSTGSTVTIGTGSGGEADGTTGANDKQYLATILIGTYSVSAEPAGCNSDTVLGNVGVDLYLLPGGEVSGEIVDSGSTVEVVSRCPNTDFGGLADVGDSLLEVSGQLTSDGLQLSLAATDEFEFFLADGTVLGTTSIMSSFLEEAQATSPGVTGTAMDFTIESDTMASLTDTNTSAQFVGSDSQDDGAWWDSDINIFFYSESKF